MPYVMVFTRDFAPGEHWNDKARADDPDRKQHWRAGDVYSTTPSETFDPSTLPAHLEAVQVPRLAHPGETWDPAQRVFRDPSPAETEDRMLEAMVQAARQFAPQLSEAEAAALKSSLRTTTLGPIRMARSR
jgi:hypothetical protein